MLTKLALSAALLTAIGIGPVLAQAPASPDVRSPALGDPGAQPPAQHHTRFRRPPHPPRSTGVGNAPDRAAAGGGGR